MSTIISLRLLGGHGDLEAVEALGAALVPVAHLGIGDADDAIRRRAFGDLRVALLVRLDVVAHDLDQQPAGRPHIGVVHLLGRQVQGGFGILEQHLELFGPLGGVRPVDLGLAVLFEVGGHQALRLGRQPTLFAAAA